MRIVRWAAGPLVAIVLCSVAIPAGPAAAATAPPTDAFCEALDGYFEVAMNLAFVVIFDKIGDADENGDDSRASDDTESEESSVLSQFLLVLSPRLQRLTRTLAAETGKPLKSLFRSQAKIFGAGVALLRKAGFTEEALELIASTPLEGSDEAEPDLLDELGITNDDIERIARKFEPKLAGIDLLEFPAKQQDAFQRVGSQCGVFPGVLDCESVFPESEAEDLLGGPVTLEEDPCSYKGEEPSDRNASSLEFSVFESAKAFETRTSEFSDASDISGVGDEAVTVEGFNGFGRTSSCGRSIFVLDGDRTLQLALCLGDEDVSDRMLVDVAEQILEGLS